MAPARPLTARLSEFAPYLAHLGLTLALFAPILFQGRMLFHRDVSTVYYPDYVFVGRSLAQGVWPLWYPDADAGAPFFMAYPILVLLIGTLGAAGALAVAPPLHVLLAMSGMTLLARERGSGAWGAWAAGAIFGLSGYVLSSLLFPVFFALAWTPLILWVWGRLQDSPTGPRVAALAALGALQLSTFGGELVAQTALLALLLRPPRLERRRVMAACGTAALALMLAAPVWSGARAMLQGTPRGSGFAASEALSFSAPPIVMLEGLLPRFLGDVHTFSDLGFWGQPFFPEGYPFLLSFYLGIPTLALALLAGRDRLWIAVVLGITLSLGDQGPLAGGLALAMKLFRVPVKFFFLTTFAIALLAGRGIDRALSSERRTAVPLGLSGVALLVVAGVARFAPDVLVLGLRAWHPEIGDWRPLAVVSGLWPSAFLQTGLLACAAALSLRGPLRFRPLAAVAVVIDLLAVNGGLNPSASRAFYQLREPTRQLVQATSQEGRYRWFSLGLSATPPIHFQPAITAANNDVWLYALERQALLPRAQVLDGLEGALDEDRIGLLPFGAALPVALRNPAHLASIRGRLRMANVRWLVSWHELPSETFELRGRVQHPEVLEPMLVYALRDALPRAFWVPEAEVMPDAARRWARLEDATFDPRRAVLLAAPASSATPAADASAPASVTYQLVDPHTVKLEVESPPGFVVVLDGFHADWRAAGPGGAVPVLSANGRYRAIPTPGGRSVIFMSYRPAWLVPSLAACLTGLLLALSISKPIKALKRSRLDTPAGPERESAGTKP